MERRFHERLSLFMKHPQYNVRHAWLRAFAYFAMCFALSWVTGVLPKLLTAPLVTGENLSNISWLGFTLLCFAVEYVGYYIIWRKGTLTHGRELSWLTVIVFGGLWGLSEGQLFLSVWAIIGWFTTSKIAIGLITFFIIATFLGLWHSLYWDIYVAPEHNIAEWNLRKVLFAHIPNLLVTLTYFGFYENAGMFVLFQTFSLMGSTYFMRFSPFWTKRFLTK